MESAGRGRRSQGGWCLLTPASAGDTIVALSSGAPPAAIAIIRLSGPAALSSAVRLAGRLPRPRHAGLRILRDGDGAILDQAVLLVFPAPTSATGEDVVEFHCHGGRAVVAAIERALIAMPEVRLAQPGEFTRRALFNGRIDLAEAEGLADLLEAETETQRRAAVMAAEGQVSRAVRGWIDRLAILSAEIEASIDYAEEGDVEREAVSLTMIDTARRTLAADLQAALATPPVERWRDGIRIVVAGPPNAGKSTLVNLLGGRDAAIVSAVPGTTRDRIEVPVRRNGVAYLLVDTAGLRSATADPIEKVGIELARDAIAIADIVLWLGDGSPPSDDMLWVHARADLPERRAMPAGPVAAIRQDEFGSIDHLWRLIEAAAQPLVAVGTVPFHRREWALCEEAVNYLVADERDSELVGENIRQAAQALSAIIGANATELMLDALFSRFCLGK